MGGVYTDTCKAKGSAIPLQIAVHHIDVAIFNSIPFTRVDLVVFEQCDATL
jgi:hypothetical protein